MRSIFKLRSLTSNRRFVSNSTSAIMKIFEVKGLGYGKQETGG